MQPILITLPTADYRPFQTLSHTFADHILAARWDAAEVAPGITQCREVILRLPAVTSPTDIVRSLIRTRFTPDDEIALLRQKDRKPQEWAEYDAWCEAAKAFVHTATLNTERVEEER